MNKLLILGAGTGGTIAANMLRSRLHRNEWNITVVDKADQHLYQPGLLFIPFRLYGYESEKNIAKPVRKLLPRGVEHVQAEVRLIDHENKRVETGEGTLDYDWLICALGCHTALGEIEGLQKALGGNAHSFYTLPDAMRLQKALDGMTEGRLVINIADMPIKCPVAPIEFAFLSDYYFHQKNIRDRIEITFVTPYSGAFTKPVASKILSGVAEEKGIQIVSDFALERVDGEKRIIHSYEGGELAYDLLVTVPPNLGPEVIDASGLGDGTGYALTDPRTLKSRKAGHIYFMGDNSNVATSKAGSVTHFEAETVVENVLREIEGEKPLPSFDGHANCFIETGYHKAMHLDFNYDVEPLPGSFPVPGAGPFSLLQESYLNHFGKIAFDWVYWNMLLPGYLPHVPLLPSHMSYLGKDLQSAPQVRRSQTMHVRDVMTPDVVTIGQGSPLADAAAIMTKKKISGLPVIDVDDRLIGIITEADFLSAIDIEPHDALLEAIENTLRKGRLRKAMGTIVDDLMTRDPVTIGPDETLQRAVHLMDANNIKRLVITDDDRQVRGMLAREDILRLFISKV